MSIPAVERASGVLGGFDLRYGDLSPGAKNYADGLLEKMRGILTNAHVSSLEEFVKQAHDPAHAETVASLNDLTARLEALLADGRVSIDWEHMVSKDTIEFSDCVTGMTALSDGNICVGVGARDTSMQNIYLWDVAHKKVRAGKEHMLPAGPVLNPIIVGITHDDTIVIRDNYYKDPLFVWNPYGDISMPIARRPRLDERVVYDDTYSKDVLVASTDGFIRRYDVRDGHHVSSQKVDHSSVRAEHLAAVTSDGLFVFEEDTAVYLFDRAGMRSSLSTGGVKAKSPWPMSQVATLPNGDVVCQLNHYNGSYWTDLWIWDAKKDQWRGWLNLTMMRFPAKVVPVPSEPDIVTVLASTGPETALMVVRASDSQVVWMNTWEQTDPRQEPKVAPSLAVSPAGVIYASMNNVIQVTGGI